MNRKSTSALASAGQDAPSTPTRAARACTQPAVARGFNVIELMLAVTIFGVLAAVAVPVFTGALDQAHVAQATRDIATMEQAISRFQSQNWRMPTSLAEVNYGALLDPWGYPYRYTPFLTPADFKNARKDKKLHPLNPDYDLYSVGKDGKTALPLTAKPSQDDVVRANGGSFIGLASDY